MKDKTILIYVQDYLAKDLSTVHSQEELNIPLGILYLGSYLCSQGHEVKLVDTRLYIKDDFFKMLKHSLDGCMLAGLSVMTPCIKNALDITKFIKRINPAIKIVWGGVHATLFPESTELENNIDFVIVKEGEIALLELAEYLSGNTTKISDIPNLVFKESNRVIKNRIGNECDLELLGLPNYGLLEMEKYVDRQIWPGYRRKQVEVITSRGCPHRCAFCVNTVAYGSRWSSESLNRTLENLDRVIKGYGVQHIFFMDEDFFCNRKRIRKLVEEIERRNITWEANCRADYISPDYMDDDFLNMLKQSGCMRLRLGLESGSQRVLDMLKKDIIARQSMNAVENLTRCKILPSASFMMGLPDETVSDILKTVDLIAKLFAINPKIDVIGPLVFRPYPGSELFKKCQEKGLVIPKRLDDWSDFYIHNTLEEYKKGLPWFRDVYIFRRVWLFVEYLRVALKITLLKWPIRHIIKFHIITRLRFIYIDYTFYGIIKHLFIKVKKI